MAVEQRAAPERRQELGRDRIERGVVRPVEALDEIVAGPRIGIAQRPSVGRARVDDALAGRLGRLPLGVAEPLRVDDEPREPG